MNPAGFRRDAILVVIVTGAVLLAPFISLAQSGGFAISPIIKRGDAITDGGRFFDCDGCEGRVVGLHALNNKGEAAIGADTSGTCFEGRFLITEGSNIRLADFCQQTPFGKVGILGPVNLNQRSEAAMLVAVPGDGRLDAALLLYSEGQITKLVQEGDVSPIGTIFKGCGFGEPAINNNGDVAFFACGETKEGFFLGDGAYVYSGGEIRKVVVSNDPSPIGGTFALNFIPAQSVQMNDRGDVLFRAGVILDPFVKEKFGLFLATNDGFKKIEVDGERMPSGEEIKEGSLGIGDLNNNGDVAFVVGLAGQSDGGIFRHSGGSINKVVVAGDPSPIGGAFSPFDRGPNEAFPLPHINGNGAIAFKAFVTNGSASYGVFLASPTAAVKVVAVGDQLPTGETIRLIDTFALNDLGQVAFFAYGKKNKTKPLGVYMATPLAPRISSVKLKQKVSGFQLRVNGAGMITNDTVIEINGVPLAATDYPSDFRENGGLSTRAVSRDARLNQLIPSGQAVQVTVFNSLTNLRSTPVMLTR